MTDERPLNFVMMCPSTGGHEPAVESWYRTSGHRWPVMVDDTTEGEAAGFLSKLQRFYAERADVDIIAYLHSDLTIHEMDWDRRVRAEFKDESVGVVGFVGATRLGMPDLYRVPYDYRQLARADVWSNLSDAEVHGGRDAGTREVAVLDSCAIVVRRSLLARAGGWPVASYPDSSHCSDLWLCCMARRLGMRVRLVGVAATHTGGGKGAAGTEWLDARGGDSALHQAAHVVTYEEFRDVLPIEVRA